MQVINKPITNTIKGQSSTTLTSVSNYIRLFTIPSRSACSFNISAVIGGFHFGAVGALTAAWNTAVITATVSEETGGLNGIYAFRADMPTDGGDVTFYLVFGNSPVGNLNVQTTLNYASAVDTPTIHTISLDAAPSSVKADLQVRAADHSNSWGTTAVEY